MDGDEIDNGRVDGGKQKQPEHNADDEAEDVAQAGAEHAADEIFSHVTEHVVTHALSMRRIDITVDDLQAAERVHRQPEQRGEDADLYHHPENGAGGSSAN